MVLIAEVGGYYDARHYPIPPSVVMVVIVVLLVVATVLLYATRD